MVSTNSPDDRAWVEVNLANLVSNAETVTAAVGGARLLPMVKADAYGLGVERVVRALEPLDPWGYGVATVPEGIELRSLGITRPLVVFTPAYPALREAYRAFQLTAVLDRPELMGSWDRPFHLEIDTGMSRCGVRWDSPALAACRSPRLEGVFTHFYSADERAETVAVQWERFQQALRHVENPGLIHAANSAGAFSLQEKLDLVRPGVFLYGSPTREDLPRPRPVASVRARVVSLRQLQPGDTVSYGGDWVASSETVVATLGIGFADGIARAVQGRYSVLLGGVRCPVLGRVTMDMTMVDVSDLPPGAAAPGSIATLLGCDGDDEIELADYARASGTSTYEVLVRLKTRLPRIYQGEGTDG